MGWVSKGRGSWSVSQAFHLKLISIGERADKIQNASWLAHTLEAWDDTRQVLFDSNSTSGR